MSDQTSNKEKQMLAVLEYCKGPEDEKRFAGLMLLTKIEGAREFLTSTAGTVILPL